MATVDHLRTRYDPTRWLKQSVPNETRTVLACFECNNNRAKRDGKMRPIEELRRRGKGWRLNAGLFNKHCANSLQEVVAILGCDDIISA
jgi:hypothetical protein